MERGPPSRSSPSHRNRRLLNPMAIAVCVGVCMCMYVRITMCVYVCVRVFT